LISHEVLNTTTQLLLLSLSIAFDTQITINCSDISIVTRLNHQHRFVQFLREKPLKPIKAKVAQWITSTGSPSKPKSIMIGRGGVAAPRVGEVVGWRRFFPETSRASSQPTPSAWVPHYYTSIDAVSAKAVPFEDFIDMSHPIGELSPKAPHFGDVNKDFQLKRLRACLGKGETNHDVW
jgi:hypothetical protein